MKEFCMETGYYPIKVQYLETLMKAASKFNNDIDTMSAKVNDGK